MFKQGGRSVIHLGDTDVEYHPSFQLYMTTPLANPHYLPEVCIKVTLVNFTVTRPGLEEQLLAELVRKERPNLQATRDRLLLSISTDKRQLKVSLLYCHVAVPLHKSSGSAFSNFILLFSCVKAFLPSPLHEGVLQSTEIPRAQQGK